MRRPFVWFVLGLAVGIIGGMYLTGLKAAAVFIFCVASALGFSYKNRIFEYMYVPLLAVIGFMLCRSAMGTADISSEKIVGRESVVVGMVRNYYITESGKTAVTVKTKSITDGNITCEKSQKIFLTAEDAEVHAGDVIEAHGKLYCFEEPTNPYQTDYRIYMKSKGYDYSFWCDDIRKISTDNGIIYKIEKARENVNRFFDENMGESEAAIAKALTTGYKYDIPDNTEKTFRNLGISHVLAVSGLHVSLVSGILFALLRVVFKMRKRTAAVPTAIFLTAYFIFTGCSPSAARAVIMTLTAFAALVFYKNSDRYNTIAFSAFILLCINPLYLWNVSFQLSFLGITAVVLALDIIKNTGRTSKTAKAFIFSVIIWIITTPLTMYYFGGVSLIAPIANIVIVPYISIVTGAAVVSSAVSATPIGAAAVRFLDCLLEFYNLAADKIPSEVLYMSTAKPSLYAVIIMYILIFACLIFGTKKYANRFMIGAFSAFMVLQCVVNKTAPAEIVFFDAGQGDASIIHIPEKFTAVVDGGPSGEAENTVIPYLNAKGEKADVLFITHMDSDHSGGALELIENDMTELVVVSDTKHNEILDKVIDEADKNNIEVYYASAGDKFVTDRYTVECLYPFYGDMTAEENESSLVLKADIDGIKILFTGDIEYEDEIRLMDSDIECDIIKIAHHGSNTSSSADFIEKTNADIAVIESGENNIYGFPHKQVLDTLEEYGVETYITGENGAVKVVLKKDGYDVKTYKGR